MTNSLSDVKVTSGFLDSFSIRLLGRLCAALFTIYLASSPSLTTVNERLTTVNEREYESSFSLWKFRHRARLRQGNISTAANSRDFAFSDTVNFVTAVAPRTLSEWK
jgi:hypothetical protein